MIFIHLLEGGEGSGNFGHSGRPGQVGGSDNEHSNAPEASKGKSEEKKIVTDLIPSRKLFQLVVDLEFIFKGPKNDGKGNILLPSPFYRASLRDFARKQGFKYFDSNRGVWLKHGDSKELGLLQKEWNEFWDINPNENFKGWLERTRPDVFKGYNEMNLPGLENPEDRWK